MLPTGQLLTRLAPGLSATHGLPYRGPWRLPGPDSHRLAALSLSSGYAITTASPSWRPAPLGAGTWLDDEALRRSLATRPPGHLDQLGLCVVQRRKRRH